MIKSSDFKSKYFVLTYDLILPFLVILLIGAGLWLALGSSLFAIQEVKCTLDFEVCESGPVLSELDKYRGHNLLTFDKDALESRLTTGDFTIREANFKRDFPATLLVELQSVYPVVASRVEGVEGEWLVFDQELRVIGLHRTDPNVPTVLLTNPISVRIGEKIQDAQLVRALEFAISVGSDLPSIRTISLAGDTLTLYLESGQQALLSTTKDWRVQIRTLQALLTDTTIEGEVRIIDVRFDKPVLR